ncbi:MAG: NBR1-Ig-like domain-containing protein [Anaerolineales bacterium]
MNTNKISRNMRIALPLLILVVMGLVGCDALEVSTVEAKVVDANPIVVEAVEIMNNEIQMEPDNGSANAIPIDQLPSVAEASPLLKDDDAIRAALAAHFEVDESTFYHFGVKENTGSHARGGVDNGYFLAAKVDGQWLFVDGGHAAPNCNEVAKYGFPASMVPGCPTGGSNSPDCPGLGTTVATFITDVTFPDGSIVSPGSSFIKTWRIKNVGTCTWNSEYALVFESGDAMSGPAYQQLTDIHIPPGESIDISVQLTAPDTPGTYRGDWKFRGPYGDIFGLSTGNPIWVEVKVLQ